MVTYKTIAIVLLLTIGAWAEGQDALSAAEVYSVCGVDPTSVPAPLVNSLQNLLDGTLSIEYTRSFLYTLNMVNSDFIPALPCLGAIIRRSL